MLAGLIMFVKICGITNIDDALAAAEYGAAAIGLNFWRPGKRYIDPERAAEIAGALPARVRRVGVFVDERAETVREIAGRVKLDVLQLHGEETPAYLATLGPYEMWKAVKMAPGWDAASLAGYGNVSAFLLDSPGATPGGTGETFDWDWAARARPYGRVILAGGLTSENVAAAVRRARPWGVDVASGVESAPGKKDHAKMRDFIAVAQGAES
jgi:phosphoribosylanthranilate isomerase